MDNRPISSEVAGTVQQIVNNMTGPIEINGSEIVYIGCNNGRLPESSSRKRLLSVDIDPLDCNELKEYYQTTLCKAVPLPWYHTYTWDVNEVYSELALQNSAGPKFGVEELFQKWHEIEHFKKGGSYRILIEGDAGYGKSTLMHKITSDWSERDSNDAATNYTSPFTLLLMIKLGSVGEDGKILSYMESIYNDKMDRPLENVLKSKGAEKVLILLDGYDEANVKTKKEVGRIMEKEMLSKCHVVLTSRCGHVPNDVKGRALLITVKGFGQRQVTVAVGKFFIKAGHVTKDNVISCTAELSTTNKEPDRFEQYHQTMNRLSFGGADSSHKLDDLILPSIDDFKNIQEIFPLLPEEERLSLEQFKRFIRQVLAESPYKELAQCPLLCVMLCCLVSECPNGELPSTCSGLYFAMINRNLYRAAIKKSRAAGEDVDEWNWSVLDSKIREGHESYLQEFGRLCIDGLMNKQMSFTLFQIVGNEQAANAADVKVTQLIEAGVLVREFTELDTSRGFHHQPQRSKKTPCFQVPHRTTAEFLAAYYLSRQTDKDVAELTCLLDLFRLNTSFDEISDFLLEMGERRCLANAFHAVKFSSFFLRDKNFNIKSYFTQHGAADTWSEFELALPNQLCIECTDLSGSKKNACLGDVTVSSPKPSISLLQLVEEFGKVSTGNQNAFRSLQKNCPISLVVRTVGKLGALQIPFLLESVLKSGVVLNSLQYLYNFVGKPAQPSDQMRQDSARRLRALLQADSCPVQMSFENVPDSLLGSVVEAMEEVPEACRLKSFAFFEAMVHDITAQLLKVLTEKWLSHLQHLGMELKDWSSGDTLHPIFKRITEPGCSLTSLHLRNYTRDFDGKSGPLLEDLMMLATKLERIKLEEIDLYFDVSRTSNYAVKEKFSLKSLHLVKVSLTLDGMLSSADENKELLLAWRNVALNLEEFSIDDFTFPSELFNWLNLTAPNLRTVAIGAIYNGEELYANQLLEALTRSSGDSIENMSLDRSFWESSDVLMLHPIREALQRCPRMKSVNLGMSRLPDTSRASIGPDPSTPLSSSDTEALNSNNVALALFEIVLNVPNLQTLTSRLFFDYCEKLGTFHALANKAKKWPGKRNDSECNTSLTLQDLSNRNACHAIQVFRERGIEYCLRYVAHRAYKVWFPSSSLNS